MKWAGLALAAAIGAAMVAQAFAQDTVPVQPVAHPLQSQESVGLAYRQLGLALQQMMRDLDMARAQLVAEQTDKAKPAEKSAEPSAK